MCIVILIKIFEFIGIIWYHMIPSPLSLFRSVTWQVRAISKGIEISFARIPPTTSGIQKFDFHNSRYFLGNHEQL